MENNIIEMNSSNITAEASSATDIKDNNTMYHVRLREEVWVIPLITIASINIVSIFFFEIYVLYKSCGSRRHLFLGQMLLLGLFLCSALGFAFVPTPHWITCAVARAGVGIAYVLVFATLLVKCVFLLSLHEGVYLSSAYQGLLLFFALSVQVVIAVQWLFYRPPEVVSDDHVCMTSSSDMTLSLVYAMFLLFLVVISVISAKGLKENNKESLYIGVAVGLIVPIWVAWTTVGLVIGDPYYEVAEAFGIVLTASAVFLVVFLPKAHQLATADRHVDRGSTGSHSVYTPSFLQLQPHSVLPTPQGTLIKQQVGADYYRPPPHRFWRYDCGSFHQMEAPTNGYGTAELMLQRKPNVTFAHVPLY